MVLTTNGRQLQKLWVHLHFINEKHGQGPVLLVPFAWWLECVVDRFCAARTWTLTVTPTAPLPLWLYMRLRMVYPRKSRWLAMA